MASLKELARQIETVKLEESKVEDLKGSNVRTPSLIPGQFYLGKTWKPSVENSDNPWLALRFIGSGSEEDNGDRKMAEANPRIKDMHPEDFYLFDRFLDGKNGEMKAYQSNDCLVIGDAAIRITFFEISGITVQTKPVRAAKAKDDKTPKVARVKKSASDTAKPKKEKTTKPKASKKNAAEETAAEAPTTDQVDPEVVTETEVVQETPTHEEITPTESTEHEAPTAEDDNKSSEDNDGKSTPEE